MVRPSWEFSGQWTNRRTGSRLENLSLFVSQRIGSCAVREHLGSGGSGLVYRALNIDLGQTACLKVVAPFKSEFAGLTATISRGVRGLAALKKPAIVRIFDFGPVKLADASSLNVAMGFIAGVPLGHGA